MSRTYPATLARLSEAHARAMPDRIAVVDGTRSLTWRQFHKAVLRAVGALRAAGLKRGDRLGFLGYNRFCYVILLQACYRSGIIMAPFNWRLSPSEISYLIKDSGIGQIFVDDAFMDLIDALAPDDRPAGVIPLALEQPGKSGFDQWLVAHRPDDGDVVEDPGSLALLIYTSGTTGFPKGACLSQHNIISAFQNAGSTGEAWGEWNRDTVAMLATPIFHIGGSGWCSHALIGGGKIIVLTRPEVGAMVDVIPRYGVTKFFAVPAMLNMMLNDPAAADADFGSVRHLLYGASPIPLDVLSRSMQKFPNAGFIQLYGATETSGNGTWLSADNHHVGGTPRMASCGKAYEGTAVRIVGGDGAVLTPHAIGEIQIHSPCVMDGGYLGRPEATAEVIRDGWYATGDAGYLDEDGYLYIFDRLKDMIVSGGENIYPAEVENALSSHPAVADCAVIGVPDDRWGEAVKAIVVRAAGVDVDSEALREHLRGRIAGFKIPKTVDFVPELPRTPTGKVLKRELRRKYWEGKGRQVA